MMKKILLFLLFLSVIPLAQLKADSYTDGNGVTWQYTLNGGNATITGASPVPTVLNIPAKVGTALEYNVTAIGDWAFYNTNITKITAPASVITIGNYAFTNCYRLTNLELPGVETIGNQVFYGCSKLAGALELPNVTSIGNRAFQSLTGLIGKLELPRATTIGSQAFQYCTGLTGLELPNVTSIDDNAFHGCLGLIGDLELPNVTTIGSQAFGDCRGLTGKLNLPKVITIGNSAFSRASPRGKLELPNTLTTLGGSAFEACDYLETVKFENGTVLTNITGGQQFRDCISLKYIDMTGVTLPSGVTISKSSDYDSFFYGTLFYTMVYLPASAPTARRYEQNFVIGNTCDRFVVYDRHDRYKSGAVGCDYQILYPFTATTAEYIDRKFNSPNCKTICLPYKATLPAGLRAYKLVAKTGGGKRF